MINVKTYRSRSSSVWTAAVFPVLAGAALLAGPPGDALPIRTASILVGVAGAALHVGARRRRELVRAASVLRGHAAAPLEGRAAGGGGVIGAAAELSELAAAALVVRALSRCGRKSCKHSFDLSPSPSSSHLRRCQDSSRTLS